MAHIAVKAAVGLGQNLLSVGADMASEEIRLLRGVRDEIRLIIEELQIMSPFIRDAEAREMFDDAAKAWLDQVRDLAYIAEDCIEDFRLHLIHRRSNNKNSRVFSTLKYLSHAFFTLGKRHKIASKLQALKSKVDIAGIRRQRYGLTAAGRGLSKDEFNPAKYINVYEGKLTERQSQELLKEVHKEWVEEMLFNKAERQRSLIAVVVPKEEGRTTIVRKVYESPNVAVRFTCRALIEDPWMKEIENVLRALIKQVLPDHPDDLDTMGLN